MTQDCGPATSSSLSMDSRLTIRRSSRGWLRTRKSEQPRPSRCCETDARFNSNCRSARAHGRAVERPPRLEVFEGAAEPYRRRQRLRNRFRRLVAIPRDAHNDWFVAADHAAAHELD